MPGTPGYRREGGSASGVSGDCGGRDKCREAKVEEAECRVKPWVGEHVWVYSMYVCMCLSISETVRWIHSYVSMCLYSLLGSAWGKMYSLQGCGRGDSRKSLSCVPTSPEQKSLRRDIPHTRNKGWWVQWLWMRNVFHRLMYLNTWSLVGGHTVWEGFRPFRPSLGGNVSVEVDFGVLTLCSLPVLPVCRWNVVNCSLPPPVPCLPCHVMPRVNPVYVGSWYFITTESLIQWGSY